MKSAQLLICLTIASLMIGCGSQKNNVDESGLSAEVLVGADRESNSDDSLVASQVLSTTRQGDGTSTEKLEGFTSQPHISASKPAKSNVTHQALDEVAAFSKVSNSSDLTSLQTGRDNPFALAEQPDFEVRFLPAEAPASLPPVPNIGLGPEPGASLQPVAVPMELTPSTTTMVVPQQQAEIAVAANPQLVPSTSIVSPAGASVTTAPIISPTALAEAVEIKGVVQLGDQIAVIVNEGEGRLSRTVQPGARLAGGQVELRRIETTTAEPQVVLVQNGVEIVRGVGV